MRKSRLVKTASETVSGTILHNSSPAAIEELLVGEMKEALGQWKNAVQIKPFLQIEDGDADLSGNVTNAYGAIQLDVYGVKLFIPFIIANKTLLPFDVIRMGEEEVAYDYAKLRRIVNAIESQKKSTGETGSAAGDPQFETMEVAKFEDIQPNNGFLGNIMQIRDNHRAKNVDGSNPWEGPAFGVMDDERMLRTAGAKVDVLDGFHQVMEKVAQVKVYTQAQIDAFAEHIHKQAELEAEEELEKTAAAEDTMEAARVKRDMIKLSEETLFNVHRAASGNDIAFPVFLDGRFEYRMGRVYRQFESWLKTEKDYSSAKIDALVLDSKGGYRFLKSNEPFMASTRKPGNFELLTERTRGLEKGNMYTIEKDTSTLFNPFTVESSHLDDVVRDTLMVIKAKDRSVNTMFVDTFSCREVLPGKYSYGKSNEVSFSSRHFAIIVSKDPEIKEPTFMNEGELREYVTKRAEDYGDAQLAMNMAGWSETFVLIPENYVFLKMHENISNYYTRPDGLFKEGPLAKTAAFTPGKGAYGSENKAVLYIKTTRGPKTYDLKWQFTQPSPVDGVDATKLERRSVEGLSKDQAQSMLDKLGFDFRTQAKFFEITDRNGRSATFELPNPDRASRVAAPDQAALKVKSKMKGLADSMLHSKNFMPILEDTIAGGLGAVLATTIPNSVNAAHDLSNFFDWSKEAMETAVELEKIATQFNGPEWHEVSALVNMKYRLDKLAGEIVSGNYLYNAEEVFEKVAEMQPVIEKKASELIKFNRQQLLHTDSYLVHPKLIKTALHHLDGLARYASADLCKHNFEKSGDQRKCTKCGKTDILLPSDEELKKKEPMSKEAGLFGWGGDPNRTRQLEAQIAEISEALAKSHGDYDHHNAKLRSVMDQGSDSPIVQQTLGQVAGSEQDLSDRAQELQGLYASHGEQAQANANRNLAIAAGVGLPGLVGLSYGYESAKNNN